MSTRQPELPAKDRGSPDDRARLALSEAVLFSDDPTAAARGVLRWLATHAGLVEGVVLVRDPEAPLLITIGAEGGGADFVVDLAQHDHPLVVVLEGKRPVHFKKSGRRPHPETPFANPDFHAVPLLGPDTDSPALGLLLVTGSVGLVVPAEWAAQLLGVRLAADAYSSSLRSQARIERDVGLLQNVVDAVSDPILVTDAEGRLMVANQQAKALLQADEGASDGRRRAVSLNNMLFSAAAFTTGSAPRPKHEVLLVDPELGDDLLFELLRTNVEDPRSGSLLVSVLRNVNDLRRATQEIEENDHRLRGAEGDVRAERDQLDLILNTVVDPILVTDPSGGVVRVNAPAARLLLGQNDNPAIERRIQANHAVLSSFVSNLYTGQLLRWRAQLTFIDPEGGDALPYEAIAGQVLSQHGEVTSVVVTLHDQREAMEKARLYERVKSHSEELKGKIDEATAELLERNELLQRQAFELEQASSAKSQFLANMSHELRTPLTAIIGYTSLLLHGTSGDVPPKQRHKLERVDTNARHLLALINDLLDISRIEAGKMPLKLERFHLRDLVDELMADIAPMLARPNIETRVEIPASLPIMNSDRQKIKQVVLNLLSNALKFTTSGSVRLVAEQRGKRVAISVIDTGIGVAPEDQQKIFEDFRQVDNSYSRQYGGTGLGLSISKRLAERLGGRIDLVSQVGRGSTFTLDVPLEMETHERQAALN